MTLSDEYRTEGAEIGVADHPPTVIENTTIDLEVAQGELLEICKFLAQKLEGVIKIPYVRDDNILADSPSKDTDLHSPLAQKLSSCTARTRSTIRIIEHLVKNLEA